MGQLQQLARAQRIEYKICNDEYKATATEMQDFRDLLSSLQKVQRSEPSTSSVVTPQGTSLETRLQALKGKRERKEITPEQYYEERTKLLEGF